MLIYPYFRIILLQPDPKVNPFFGINFTLFQLILNKDRSHDIIMFKDPNKQEAHMQISIDYTVALNVLITCSLFDNEKVTANFIAQKTGGDGTTIREVMYKLKTAGFITNKPGPGGTKLAKDLSDVTLYDVYEAVLNPSVSMLKFYEVKENEETLASEIRNTVDKQFNQYKNLVLNEMRNTSIAQLCEIIKKKNGQHKKIGSRQNSPS